MSIDYNTLPDNKSLRQPKYPEPTELIYKGMVDAFRQIDIDRPGLVKQAMTGNDGKGDFPVIAWLGAQGYIMARINHDGDTGKAASYARQSFIRMMKASDISSQNNPSFISLEEAEKR